MPRSRRSWTELAAAAAAGALGIAAESNSYAWSDSRHWLPDLLTGWVLVACGLIARRRAGSLLAATGFTWFAGNFTSSALVLHRGPLVHAALTYPAGAAGQLAYVTFGYVVAVTSATWWGNAGTFALAGTLLVGSTRRYFGTVGRPHREARYALRGAVLLAVVLGLVATADLTRDTAGTRDATLLAYQASLCAFAVYVAWGALRRPWERAVTDLVVDLGETRARTVRDALAQALGDPTLEVAYRLDGGYVDASGRATTLPPLRSRRHVTEVEDAVLVHDPALLDDPALVEAVAAATRLAAANARLQAEVRAQVAELEASRLRLVEAGDAERARLETRLREGAARRLAALEAQLAEARAVAGPSAASAIDQAARQLERTTSDLGELASGLHPRDLSEHGLARAIDALADRSPLPVETSIRVGRLSEQLEVAVYFVCSEALANVAKHAEASHASIAIEDTGTTIRVEVCDDGCGGAEPRAIADRVDALGGRLVVVSPPNGGTRLLAEFPR